MYDPDEAFYHRMRSLLEDAYVAADERGDVFGGSGCGAKDVARWEARRRIIAEAFDRDGDWLDVGCANGLLMETLVRWTADKGCRIEPYGLDISDRIAERARKRLPHWADRIFTGNVMHWEPPSRFDYVTAVADCVPENRRSNLIRRLADTFLRRRGRLILSCYTPGAFLLGPAATTAESPAQLLLAAGLDPIREVEAHDAQSGVIKTRTAWADVGV